MGVLKQPKLIDKIEGGPKTGQIVRQKTLES